MTLLRLLIGLPIGLAICLFLPGFVTLLCPVSWIQFARTGDQVSFKADVCWFFVIPFRRERMDSVVGIDTHFIQGELQRRKTGQVRRPRSDSEGFLVIRGELEEVIEVPVTPFNLKSVKERARSFLIESQDAELKMIVVANWKFGIIAGGLLCLVPALFIAGLVRLLCIYIRGLYRVNHVAKNASSTVYPQE